MSDIEEVPECLHLKKCPTSGPALRMHMVNAHMNGPRKKCGVCPHNTAGNMGAVGGRRNIQSSDSRTKAFEDATEFPIINPYGELLEVEMLAEIRKDQSSSNRSLYLIAEDSQTYQQDATIRANKKTDGADYLADSTSKPTPPEQ